MVPESAKLYSPIETRLLGKTQLGQSIRYRALSHMILTPSLMEYGVSTSLPSISFKPSLLYLNPYSSK